MNITLRNVKINKRLSEETTCFSANLYVDGKFAASVANRGQGGPDECRFVSHAVERAFHAYCAGLPPVELEGVSLPMDAELLVGRLLQVHENTKLCRTKTVFRLKSDAGSMFVMQTRFSPDVKAFLLKKHGANLAEILNETLSA